MKKNEKKTNIFYAPPTTKAHIRIQMYTNITKEKAENNNNK